MDKYEVKQWLEMEYAKLEGVINSLDEASVVGLDLDDGYPDYLNVFRKAEDTYVSAKNRALSIKLPGGGRWGYDEVYGGVLIHAPSRQFKVYAYTVDQVRQMLIDERQKFVSMAIKEVREQIAEYESGIKKAQPAEAIRAQAAIDSFVNEGGDGYYRPAPVALEQVPYLTRKLSDLRQELQWWEAQIND